MWEHTELAGGFSLGQEASGLAGMVGCAPARTQPSRLGTNEQQTGLLTALTSLESPYSWMYSASGSF